MVIANEGWVVAFACVKGGSSQSPNGYVEEFGEGDGSWTVPDGLADISHAAVSFKTVDPTPTSTNTIDGTDTNTDKYTIERT